VAAALASRKDDVTILVVNESYRPVDLNMEFGRASCAASLAALFAHKGNR